MRKCPYCKSEIQENATFCLYCMTPLDEKIDMPPKKSRPSHRKLAPAVLGVMLVLALLMGIWSIWLVWPSSEPSLEAPPQSSSSGPASTQTQPTTTPPVTGMASEAGGAAPTVSPDVVFCFRSAQPEDYVNQSGYDPSAVVITGVVVPQETYVIPAYTDATGEHAIVGIMADAFFESGAKTVYTSENLRFIHKDAFRDCRLEHLYIAANQIDLDPYASNYALGTIHSSYRATAWFLYGGEDFVPLRDAAASVYNARWALYDPATETPALEDVFVPVVKPAEPALTPEDIYIVRFVEHEDIPFDPSNQYYAKLDVVIVGVKVKQESYRIPTYMDEAHCWYKIVGIMPDAFYGSGAEKVYLPESMLFVRENAFRGCDLKDLYISGSDIQLDPGAWNSLGTVHSQYRARTWYDGCEWYVPLNEAAEPIYGAKWEEWDP